jgi:hypothetical protein
VSAPEYEGNTQRRKPASQGLPIRILPVVQHCRRGFEFLDQAQCFTCIRGREHERTRAFQNRPEILSGRWFILDHEERAFAK